LLILDDVLSAVTTPPRRGSSAPSPDRAARGADGADREPPASAFGPATISPTVAAWSTTGATTSWSARPSPTVTRGGCSARQFHRRRGGDVSDLVAAAPVAYLRPDWWAFAVALLLTPAAAA
jgi:hypothetical protein